MNSGWSFSEPRKRRGKYSYSIFHYSPRLKRIIVLAYTHEVISTKSERKPLKSMIWLTDQSRESLKIDLCRIFKHGNSQAYHFTNNSVIALMEPLKIWIVSSPEKKRRALLFFVTSPSLLPKRFVVSFFPWSAEKNGGWVPRGKTSSSCSILCSIYLKRRIFANLCF